MAHLATPPAPPLSRRSVSAQLSTLPSCELCECFDDPRSPTRQISISVVAIAGAFFLANTRNTTGSRTAESKNRDITNLAVGMVLEGHTSHKKCPCMDPQGPTGMLTDRTGW